MSDFATLLEFVPDTGEPPATFNVLLFGEPKSGKSSAAATAPGPILWVNAEGPAALGYARKVARERGTQVHEVACGRGRPIQATLAAVLEHVQEGRDPRPATVVVDTLGKLREALAREVGGEQPSIQQWGKVATTLLDFVGRLRDLPVNMVLLAHTDQVDDADAGRTVKPLIGGKATELIAGDVDVVAFTSPLPGKKGEPVRYVGQLVDGRGRTGLGDRSGGGIAGGEAFTDLNLAVWLERYREGLTPEDGAVPFDVEEPGDDAA